MLFINFDMLPLLSIFVKISMRMLLIPEKKFMVFFFCEMFMEQLSHMLDKARNVLFLKARNQGVKQFILTEQTEKKSKRLFIQFPVEAETYLLKGYFFFFLGHPAMSFQFT